ncbi:MAG TPA: glycogen-binding domain-containing protein [Longimicrobium sp.]|nr:glycogen-binding domain-containing protein [Longimicrobium sp.]
MAMRSTVRHLLPGLALWAAPAFACPAAAQGPLHLPADPALNALSAGGSLDRPSGEWVPEVGAVGALRTPTLGPFSAEGRVEADGLFRPEGRGAGRLLGLGRLRLSSGGVEAWAGLGGGTVYNDHAALRAGAAEGGVRWRGRRGGLYFTVRSTAVQGTPEVWGFRDTVYTVMPMPDTLPYPGQGAVDTVRDSVRVLIAPMRPAIRYTDSEVGAEWIGGRLRLDAAVGGRAGEDGVAGRFWGRVGGDFALRHGATLHFAVGRVGGLPELGSRGGPYATLALRLSAARRPPPALALAAVAAPAEAGDFHVLADGHLRTLRVRVPGASRVEMKADFTDWRTVALDTAEEAGTWQAVFDIAPGTYRVNLRVDGGPWGAPPGLLAVADEFGGRVGLLVVG